MAYDLLDSEFFGRKNTLLDVIVAETGIERQAVIEKLKDTATALDNIRLCDLNEDNRLIYKKAMKEVYK